MFLVTLTDVLLESYIMIPILSIKKCLYIFKVLNFLLKMKYTKKKTF